MMGSQIEGAPGESAGGIPPSREVSWYSTYLFAERYAATHDVQLDHVPIPGTPDWCGMPDDDARKLLALILGGVREALANDARQQQMVDTSHDVAAAAQWISEHHRLLQNRANPRYIPRRTA